MPLLYLTRYCSTCGRNVYLDEDDEEICPVCSGPLVEPDQT